MRYFLGPVAVVFITLCFNHCSKDSNPANDTPKDTLPPILEENVILQCKIDGAQKEFATDVTAFRYPVYIMTDIHGYTDEGHKESMLVEFQADSAGRYYDSFHGIPHIEYWKGGTLYANNLVSLQHMDSCYIDVDYYGKVGDTIQGTFEALVGDGDSANPRELMITEGQFKVLRQYDYQN